MVLENHCYIEIDGQIKELGEKVDKVSYEFLYTQNGLNVNIDFKKPSSVNSIALAIDIKGFEVLFMEKLQKGQNGLVFSPSDFQKVVLRKGKKYFLLKLSGFSNIESRFFRFCTKIKNRLLYIGFFSSFSLDDNTVCFYYQNLLTSVYAGKNSKVNINIEIFEGDSLYNCILKSSSAIRYYDIKYEIFKTPYKNPIKIIEIDKCQEEDIARKFGMSLFVPGKILKLFFLYFSKKSANFHFIYDSTLQASSMYYLNLLKVSKIQQTTLIYLKKQIEDLVLNEDKIYCNFYRKNIMLTELKTYYHLPYILLLYFQLCHLSLSEPVQEVERIIEEIELNVVRHFKFFSDRTLLNIENFEERFDNFLFAQETMTIYICYELYKMLFKYYEYSSYQRIAEELKGLLVLNYNFNSGHFYTNNYSYNKEESIKLVERVDKR